MCSIKGSTSDPSSVTMKDTFCATSPLMNATSRKPVKLGDDHRRRLAPAAVREDIEPAHCFGNPNESLELSGRLLRRMLRRTTKICLQALNLSVIRYWLKRAIRYQNAHAQDSVPALSQCSFLADRLSFGVSGVVRLVATQKIHHALQFPENARVCAA